MKLTSKNNIAYAIYLAIIVVLLLEIVLRFWNPFHFRIKGEHIVLETNKTYEIDNKDIPAIDQHIIHTKNPLGFRGPAKPADFENYLSFITVGGSTTESQYLNDGKTWSDQLYRNLQNNFNKIWLNNAGIAGHSTFGHTALLQDHVSSLKPTFVLFLVGINDIGRNDLNDSDKSNMTDSYSNFFTFLSKKSELCNVIINIIRTRKAKLNKLSDTYLDLKKSRQDTLNIIDTTIQKIINDHKDYQSAYKRRLQKLLDICRENNISPILITQPLLIGQGTDSISGVNLETIRFNSQHNGKSFWMLMESYNDVTRKTAIENNILLIDAARLMPKNSLYFYDAMHYTNAGSEQMGNLVYNQLKEYLSLRYSSYKKN